MQSKVFIQSVWRGEAQEIFVYNKNKYENMNHLVGKPMSTCCIVMSIAVKKYPNKEQNREGKSLVYSSRLQSIFVGKS